MCNYFIINKCYFLFWIMTLLAPCCHGDNPTSVVQWQDNHLYPGRTGNNRSTGSVLDF